MILDDAALILRLQAGDLDALGALYDRHRLTVYRTALAITRDPDVAEDILQEAFLRLHANAHKIRTAVPLMPWLYRVTVNLSYSWFTRHKWIAPLDDLIEQFIGPARFRPESAAEQHDTQHKIQQAIDALPFGQRVVVVLHYLNDLSLHEIADIVECPVGTVKSRLYYARESLRQKLEGHALTPEMVYEFTR
jgi:RNA polymerase sigma-70 factor (ECF subfamily)